jgi:tryptophan 2,3-dioxygenase
LSRTRLAWPIFAPHSTPLPMANPPVSAAALEAEFSPAVLAQLRRLQARYTPDGQDLAAYLEGLYHADYVNYWDYIALDTLLSLQRPLTKFPDEKIFIIYHQITELYFKLCLLEYEQLGELSAPTLGEVVLRLGRVNRYFENLIDSFDVMVDGMEKEQFLQFRMSLMPASGFQSVQYRFIEIASTALENLVPAEKRRLLGDAPTHEEFMGWPVTGSMATTGKLLLLAVPVTTRDTDDDE